MVIEPFIEKCSRTWIKFDMGVRNRRERGGRCIKCLSRDRARAVFRQNSRYTRRERGRVVGGREGVGVRVSGLSIAWIGQSEVNRTLNTGYGAKFLRLLLGP